MICPNCEGRGTQWLTITHNQGIYPVHKEVPCNGCEGSGEITPPTMDEVERGNTIPLPEWDEV